MAVEVQATEYLFIRHDDEPLPELEEPDAEKKGPLFLHNYLHDIESLFWIGSHALFSTVPAKYLRDRLTERDKQRDLFNVFFPHYLEGSSQRRLFFQHARYLNAEEVLPTEYKNTLQWLLRLRRVLVHHYGRVENLPDFPQHEHFSQVYGTDQRNSNLFIAFGAVAKEAYNGHTQPLLPDKAISIARARRALVSRELGDDGDRDDDQTYIFDDLESSEDDEEPPVKVRRKNGKTKEKAAGSSHHTSFKQKSVEGTHSGGKRKRLL